MYPFPIRWTVNRLGNHQPVDTPTPYYNTAPLFQHLKKSGGKAILSTNANNVLNAQWEILIMSNDLTYEELKRKIKELEESERDYRTIVDNIPDLLYRTDHQGRIVNVTRSVYDLTGYTIEEAIGMNMVEEMYFIPEEGSIFLTKLQENGNVTNFEARLKRKNGSIWWASTNAHFYKDMHGEIKGIEGIARDISELKSTENALKESEERYRTLHDASFGGIFIHDQGIVLECNQGLSEITGYTLNELIGMDALNTLVAPAWRETVRLNIKSGFGQPYEAEGVRKDESIYPLLIQGKNIPYKGRTVRAVEYRDITEKKQADKEKEELEGKLRQAQKMEAIGRLAGGVAHDFNNMLSVILGHVRMVLADLESTNPLYSRLAKIRNAGERSAELIRQLLAFARK
jgi:two-component system, cell cycle sensor histidine kinase and response regulator CckA